MRNDLLNQPHLLHVLVLVLDAGVLAAGSLHQPARADKVHMAQRDSRAAGDRLGDLVANALALGGIIGLHLGDDDHVLGVGLLVEDAEG